MLRITSLQNQKIKDCLRLRSSQERRASGLFLIEGARELERALKSGYRCRTLYFCPHVLSSPAQAILQVLPAPSQIEVSEAVFQKIAVRDSSDGLLAIMDSKKWQLEALEGPQSPQYLVLENVEKPGNFGALARSADGAGVAGMIVLDPDADLFNPIAVRSSVGALFGLPLVACTHDEFAGFCRKKSLTILTASPFASRYHYEEDLRGPIALVLGSEAKGLSGAWSDIEHRSIKIPMLGLADSLNVSVAGAIILYEALRQRRTEQAPANDLR